MERQVEVYTNPECPNCSAVKEQLLSHGIPFIEKDITSARSVRQEMVDRTGSMSVPTMIIGEKIIIGYDQPLIEAALHREREVD